VAPSKALIQAVQQVLYPLARLLLAQGVTYPQLAERLKAVLVKVAEREFRIAGRAQTDSRVSLLSGVHRKDVRRLRAAPADEESVTARSVPLGAQLVAAWTGLRRFRDKQGLPLPLPRLASQGGGVSFESLVERVSKDIRSRAVLDELVRLGVVHMDEQDRAVLNVEAFVPRSGFDEKLHYFGHNLRDHAAAAAHNVLGGDEPLLERSVHYDALSKESIRELAALAEKSGMEAVQTLNRRAIELEERDAGGMAEKQRFTFGVYFFHAPTGSAKRAED
jgi:Family of unknown function (DUF6502)